MAKSYLLTPWSRALLEKLTGSQLVKKFPAFYGSRRFITSFTSARHLSLSWTRLMQSITQHTTSWMSILILHSHPCLGLPSGLFCFDIHFNAILGRLPSSILWTWPYHVSWFCSVSFITVYSSPICCLIVTVLILSFLDILEDLLRASISVVSTRLLLFSVSLHVSAPYNELLLIWYGHVWKITDGLSKYWPGRRKEGN